MSSPVSYVNAISFDGSETAVTPAGNTFYSVSATTDLPSNIWLRGIYFAMSLYNVALVKTDFEIWNGNNGEQVFSFPAGVLINPSSSILPEDCYWNIDNGLWVRAASTDSDDGAKTMLYARATFFYT